MRYNSSHLLKCVCGHKAHLKGSDKIMAWVECDYCIRELTGAGKRDAVYGWNAWMVALTDEIEKPGGVDPLKSVPDGA